VQIKFRLFIFMIIFINVYVYYTLHTVRLGDIEYFNIFKVSTKNIRF